MGENDRIVGLVIDNRSQTGFLFLGETESLASESTPNESDCNESLEILSKSVIGLFDNKVALSLLVVESSEVTSL